MAQNVSVKDRDAAIKWLMQIQTINEDYHQAMKEAGETLVDMENFCEGNIVDDLVEYAHNMINAAESIFNAMDSIADTVTKVLDVVDKFKDGVISAFSSTIKKIF